MLEESSNPPTYPAPATDTYALVLVDLGSGVNVTADSATKTMFSSTPSDKSFASYYAEVSYGQYTVTGDVIGPFSYTMTTCDTTGMYQAIEKQITGSYNHLVYYFNRSTLCDWGGLGEEGSVLRPAKRTWLNGSLSCVVLMQEPGHNLGLMHANSIKCGTSSFSTTPASSCTITEYGSTMSTMGSGCKQFNAYERWYMQWLSGCNGVKVPGSGTFNLLPLETICPGGTQVLQVPFPATLVVNDPQATTTNVNLKNYYLELRTAGGTFDAYSTSTRGGSVAFSGPTVFLYTSDDVKIPSSSARNGGNSVWTELINTTPSGTTITGFTAAGQSFVDPAGGPTITLTAISASGATVEISNPSGSGDPTCIDGTVLTAPGATACGPIPDGGPPGAGGSPGADASTSGSGGAAGGTDAGRARDATIPRISDASDAVGVVPGAGGSSGAGGAGGAAGSSGAGNGGAGGGRAGTVGAAGAATGGGGTAGGGGSPAGGAVTTSGGAAASPGGAGGARIDSSGGGPASSGGSAGGPSGGSSGSGGSSATTTAAPGKSGCSCRVGVSGVDRRKAALLATAALAGAALLRRRRRKDIAGRDMGLG